MVELGGRKWATRQLPDGALELSIVTASDDGRQRVAQRMDAAAHEQKEASHALAREAPTW